MDEMNRTVGILVAKVDRLIEDHADSRESRKIQYERMEAIERKQDAIIIQMESFGSRLVAVEKVTNEYKNIKLMGRGYILGSAVAGGSAVLWLHDSILAFFKVLKGG